MVKVRTAAVSAAVLLSALAGCSTPTVVPIGEDGRMVARNFEFNPDGFAIQVGQLSSVLIENEDKVRHNFRAPALDLSADVEAGGSRRINVTVDNLDGIPDNLTVAFSCRFHDFEGMRGTIRVVP